jgi:geranyl-CoA carboxylase beta subunit
MAIIESQIDNVSTEYQANYSSMNDAVNEFRAIERRVIEAAEEKAPRYKKRGLLTPRERLSLLLDSGAPFLELSTLCGYMQDGDKDGSAAGGSCITGIGYAAGTRVMVVVDDYMTKGGTIGKLGGAKRSRMMELATQNKLPMITLAQSGGGDLKGLGDWFGYTASGFANQARLSAKGIPQITVVHGSATAGGAYQPGLSDYVIMIRKQSTVYLAGPPLLKAATGEVATEEEIGGAEMHSEIAGTADYLAENDSDGIRIARDITAKIGWNKNNTIPETIKYLEPLYNKNDLLGLVPVDPKKPYDVREIIAHIADGSDYLDFKADYDMGTVCGHIEIKGHTCGVIGNNGPITARGAAKAAQFIQLCEQSTTPLLFLHNTTGFLVGTEAEQNGIIKHGAKLIQAVTNSTVPKISVVVGGSYGAGNYAMCGRGIPPRFMFAWPKSVVSVMGPEQAGSVMRQVGEAKMARMGEVNHAMLDAMEKDIVDTMEAKSRALMNTARLWDDGMIDPRDSRDIIAFALDICRDGDSRKLSPNSYGVARF